MAIKFVRAYGTESAGVAHIIYAKLKWDDGTTFCNTASGDGHISFLDNDGECVSHAKAPYMWNVPDKASLSLNIDIDELSR